MKLFCYLLAGSVLGKAPHNKAEFDDLSEEGQKKLDRDVFNFDSGEFDVRLKLVLICYLFGFCIIKTKLRRTGIHGSLMKMRSKRDSQKFSSK